jgi:ABC-2 type transport system ATP-binding protein
VIQFQSVRFQYGSKKLYENFSLQLDNPGIHGLFGTNGTGKSTMLKLINGLLFPQSGTCHVFGHLSPMRHPDMLEKIFYLPEEIDSPAITAVQLGTLKGAFYPRFDLAKLTEMLRIFGIDEKQRIHQMSYGQKKKSYIAVALSSGAPILLMDEPTNGLDIPSKLHFRQAIEQFISNDQLVLISTHQVRDLDHILQHLLILQDGHILMQDSIENIENKYQFEATAAGQVMQESLYTLSNGQTDHHLLHNTTGRRQPAHLETLITAYFEQPDSMHEKTNG